MGIPFINVDAMVKNRVADAKKKIEAIDLNHDGKSDVLEIKEKLETAEKLFEPLTHITEAEEVAALDKINQFFFAGKYTADQMKGFATGLAHLLEAEQRIVALGTELGAHGI